jgi:predicted N-acetyltransferase YhbS
MVPDWALQPEEEAQIAALLGRCFTTDFGGRSYFQQRPHLRLIWQAGGKTCGHAALVFRAIRLAGELVPIAGLADVATDPDHRGQGIAGALLARAIAVAQASPAQFMLLFGTAGLYAAQGFAGASNPLTYLDMTGARTGALRCEVVAHFAALSLKGRPWPDRSEVDLMGPLF